MLIKSQVSTIITSIQCYMTILSRYIDYIYKAWVFSSVQLLTRVRLFATPWIAACQASLSITNSRSPPKPMSIVSVMPSNHLILCRPLLLPSNFPSIRVFSNVSVLHIPFLSYVNCECSCSSYSLDNGMYH